MSSQVTKTQAHRQAKKTTADGPDLFRGIKTISATDNRSSFRANANQLSPNTSDTNKFPSLPPAAPAPAYIQPRPVTHSTTYIYGPLGRGGPARPPIRTVPVSTASAPVTRAVAAPLPPTVPQCASGICPVEKQHDSRMFDFDDEHLPFIIKETLERVRKALDTDRNPYWRDTERLDTFWTVHWFNMLQPLTQESDLTTS